MVFPILAVGVAMLAGKALQKGIESHEKRKTQQRLQVASVSASNIPRGYAPQEALLYDYQLLPGETLIATFQFTPAKWTKEMFASGEMFPRTLGSTMGIGHITSQRVILMYDLKRILGRSSWSGGKIIEHGVNEMLGKLFEGATHIESETREYMEKVARYFGPDGVVAFPREGEWGIAFGHVFYGAESRKRVGRVPMVPFAFAPGYIDDSGRGDRQALFKKVLGVGGADVSFEEEDSVPYYGTRSELARSVF
ncbi:hypothetical protein QBC37DRAFT_445634 [Rhypophila decipiens]|uniref:Uncharacterized protein n=1 Tax=Rhypophila decipiens TaxID=261697 RepID=A0AAN7BE10_9PEZI|nr:hypothetical protein QBC37DRAFT_445634 [Rhypophila decipiens]